MVFAWLEWESWILLTPEIQSSSIQWSNEDMCAYIYHINNTLKTCPLCDTGYTRCFRQPSKLWNLVLVIFAKVIWTNAIKKSQNVRKGRNRKKEFRGAKDFILVLGAWGRILTRGYPSSPVPSSWNNLISQISLSKVLSVIDFNLRTNLLTSGGLPGQLKF